MPEASRETIVETVFALVDAIVALLAWLVMLLAVPLNVAVIVPALKLPEASRATMVDAVLAFVALDVTVNEDAPAWLAVNDAEPDSPVPETAIVNVPLFATGATTQEGAAVPFD